MMTTKQADPYATWDEHKDRASDRADGYPDTRMVPIVERLRAVGIATYQSCQGHVSKVRRSDDSYVFRVQAGHLWLSGRALNDDAMLRLGKLDVFDSVSREYRREDEPIAILTWPPERFEMAVAATFAELGLSL